MKIKKSSLIFLFLLLASGLFAQVNTWINILDMGAKNDGKMKITQNIKNAIDKAVKQGGGTIYFPAGEYLTGPILLKSNITIQIDAGAVIHFSDNFEDYLPFVEMRWEGLVMKSFHPLFYAYQAENICITGRGKIDGQGKKWWDEHLRLSAEIKKNGNVLIENKLQQLWAKENSEVKAEDYYQSTMKLKFYRPPFFQPYRCKNVRVEGITIVNSPFWTINPEFCDNVTVQGVTIENPESPNTDGINPESCKNVHISNCHISVGDDCITIKSGRDADGRKYNAPCENITITNCTMLNGHGGVVIGSEMSGGVKNITISNCVFDGTDRGIRLKSMRGRGGAIENIRVSNIVMTNIKIEAFTLNLFYGKSVEEPVSDRTPCIRNIHISNVTGTKVKQVCNMVGLSEMPVQNITFNDIDMDAETGFILNTAKNIELHNVSVNVTSGSPFEITDLNYVVLNNVKGTSTTKAPIVLVNNSSNMFIYNCFPYLGTEVFLKVDGEKSAGIVLKNNVLINAKEKTVVGKSVAAGVVTEN